MAAFSTTVQKIGINGSYVANSTALINWSTATSSVTLTVGDLNNVVIACYNPEPVDNITVTISSTGTGARFAGKGQGSLNLTTALNSSCYMFFGNLESARFKSTANTIVITATTTIAVGCIELGSTKSN